MADSNYIHNVTTDNFDALVVQASQQHPVMVDFWAAWCGPCQSLTPVLEKLAAEYAGQFTLAKINADEQQMLAAQFGIRSLPTVLIVFKGEIVEHFMGAQPESAIRQMLDQHVEPPAADAKADLAAQNPYAELDPQQAVMLLQEQIAAEPDKHELKVELASALLQTGALAEAQQQLDALPADTRDSDAAKRIAAQLQFANTVEGAADATVLSEQISNDPNDLTARYQLGAQQLLMGNFAAGLDQFLEIMQRDRQFEDDLGRKSLVAAFTLIDDAELVTRYRQRMTSLLF